MYIHRKLEEPLKQALKQFPVVLITGPRQAGKSTLLRSLLKGYAYITFDDLVVRQLAEADPVLFLKTYPAPLILDEIQYVPSLLSYLKLRVDAERQRYGQYVLTGSQIFPLMKGVSESLAGRIAVFQLYPFSWEEITQVNRYDEMATIQQMLRGFYPEFQIQPDLNPQLWHSSYLSTYLERDIRVLRNIHDLAQFQRYLVLLAARAGQLFNLSEIGKECGISQTTAKDWLMLLQQTSIIFLLEPYSRNMTKRVVKSPKLYFIDTGLLCYLLRITSAEQLVHSLFAGHIFENMVLMEYVKRTTSRGERPLCYFFRSAKGEEIDLVIDQGEYLEAYEIKFSATPTPDMATSLAHFQREFPVRKAAVLSLRPDNLPLSGEVKAVHWSQMA